MPLPNKEAWREGRAKISEDTQVLSSGEVESLYAFLIQDQPVSSPSPRIPSDSSSDNSQAVPLKGSNHWLYKEAGFGKTKSCIFSRRQKCMHLPVS